MDKQIIAERALRHTDLDVKGKIYRDQKKAEVAI